MRERVPGKEIRAVAGDQVMEESAGRNLILPQSEIGTVAEF